MANSGIWAKVGVWSFIAGLIIAVVVALTGGLTAMTATVLGILGLIVGLLNVADDELQLFLLASLVFLVFAGSMGSVVGLLGDTAATWLGDFFGALVVFTGPAAFVVSLTALYHVARDK